MHRALRTSCLPSISSAMSNSSLVLFVALAVSSCPPPVCAQCETAKLVASNAACGDLFGAYLAIDGDTAVVAATGDDDGGADAGAAYVFRKTGGTWAQQQKLIASDAGAGDRFGREGVAVSQSRILVGASYASGPGNQWNGFAYLFRWTGSNWVEEQKLIPSDPQFAGHFGTSVALHGDVAAIASIHEVVGGGNESGAVYMFRRNGTTWVQEQKIIPADIAPFDYFGTSVSVYNDVVVVGSRLDDPVGSAYVFRWNGATWAQEQKLTPSDGSPYFGVSVSIHGDRIVVGADANGTPALGPGAAFVYRRIGGTWVEEQILTALDPIPGDAFGRSVSLGQAYIAIGAPFQDKKGTGAGALYLFEYQGPTWTGVKKVGASDANAYGNFGLATGLTNETVLVGMHGQDDANPSDPFCGSGSAYIYDVKLCVTGIPAVSLWGIVIMALGVVGGGALVIHRHRGRAPDNNVADALSGREPVQRSDPVRKSIRLILAGNVINLALLSTTDARPLQPRTPPPKAEAIQKPEFEARLHVKFRDDLRVRADRGELRSHAHGDLGRVRALQGRYGLTFQPLLLLPQETLDFVEQRAAQNSGRSQPDFGGVMVVSGPDETLEEAAKALLDLDETEWVQFVDAQPEPQCSDLSPVTPNYFSQGYQDYQPADPGLNMSCAWTYGGKGLQLKVAVVDAGFTSTHEDLCNVWTALTPECNIFVPEHGTAVLGQLVALDNSYGCSGLVPQASPRFYSGYSVGPDCFNYGGAAGAIVAATSHLAAGDVIVIEFGGDVDGLPGAGPAELEHATFIAVDAATDANIIVLEVAGNGGGDLDSALLGLNQWRSWGDSGAIIVGAGEPNAGTPAGDPVSRHNRCDTCIGGGNAFSSAYGSRVDVQGWGEQVFTLGFGTYCDPTCTHAGPPANGPSGYYTEQFSGTSSAAPMVAAAAASLQSIRVAKGLPRLTPAQMRQLLIDTGIPQGTATLEQHVGPFPNLAKAILAPTMGLIDVYTWDCNANNIPDGCEGGRACCLTDDGPCQVITQSCCQFLGGTYLPNYSTCAPWTCGSINGPSGP